MKEEGVRDEGGGKEVTMQVGGEGRERWDKIRGGGRRG